MTVTTRNMPFTLSYPLLYQYILVSLYCLVSGTIAQLFSGSIRSFIKCVDVDYESKREEDFYDVQLDVKDCPDIYASLEKYTAKGT